MSAMDMKVETEVCDTWPCIEWYIHRHNVAKYQKYHISNFGDINVQNELEEDRKFFQRKRRSRGKLKRPLDSSYKMIGHQITIVTSMDEADRQSWFQCAVGVCTNRNSEYKIRIFERKNGEQEVK